MAIPAIAGIGWLGNLIAGLIGGIVSALGARLTKRVANMLLVAGALITLTAGLYTAMEALASAVTPALPPQFAAACGLFLPSNTTVCLSAILTAYLLRWVYDWKVKLLTMKADAG